jgi:hypothetical protein
MATLTTDQTKKHRSVQLIKGASQTVKAIEAYFNGNLGKEDLSLLIKENMKDSFSSISDVQVSVTVSGFRIQATNLNGIKFTIS